METQGNDFTGRKKHAPVRIIRRIMSLMQIRNLEAQWLTFKLFPTVTQTKCELRFCQNAVNENQQTDAQPPHVEKSEPPRGTRAYPEF